MSQELAASAVPQSNHPNGRRLFVRHFLEMVVVMLAGMGVLGGLAMLAFAAAGSSLGEQSGELRVMLMGVYMTAPMVLGWTIVATRRSAMPRWRRRCSRRRLPLPR